MAAPGGQQPSLECPILPASLPALTARRIIATGDTRGDTGGDSISSSNLHSTAAAVRFVRPFMAPLRPPHLLPRHLLLVCARLALTLSPPLPPSKPQYSRLRRQRGQHPRIDLRVDQHPGEPVPTRLDVWSARFQQPRPQACPCTRRCWG